VTGATGYVGGRLVPELLRAGQRVRVLVRRREGLRGRPWAGQVQVTTGDLLDPSSLEGLGEGVSSAYYLVHSMGGERDFAAADRAAAENFVGAVKGLERLVYLGGLLPERPSEHLRSRAEVGRLLRERLPTTEFRAGPIIGAGSASFDVVRHLTERLPVMLAPRWVENEVRAIGVADVLAYLRLAPERPPLGVVDIGGGVLTFRQMIEEYAAVRGLRRVIVPVPVLAPKLAALWVGLVTPVRNRVAVPLVEGLVAPLVGDVARAEALFPEVRPRSYREAVEEALREAAERAVPAG
jgi:uncharacterized protein YbjT (DUF2867 family)